MNKISNINRNRNRNRRDAMHCVSTTGGFAGDKNPVPNDNLSRVMRCYKGRTAFEARKIHADFAWLSIRRMDTLHCVHTSDSRGFQPPVTGVRRRRDAMHGVSTLYGRGFHLLAAKQCIRINIINKFKL
jgi:hypothetical protein